MESQVKQLYNPIFQYIRKRINHQQDAEDLTQEVFYRLTKSDMVEIKSIKSWLFTIANNAITDYYRKKKIPTSAIDETLNHSEQRERDCAGELSECVQGFIEELPADYSKIMKLSELQNIPQKEIAKQLGMNYVTVRSKVQRGRKKLKTLFTDCCSIEQGGRGSILDYEARKESSEKKV